MSGFTCPYCSHVMAIDQNTMQDRYPSFNGVEGRSLYGSTKGIDKSCLKIVFYKCPNCGKYTIICTGVGDETDKKLINIQPRSFAKQFPEYIPLAIREDYEEACMIVDLSPKASATLSRRCLQGMIHDYWGITGKNLNAEITALQGKIPSDLWNTIDAVRQLGNIGAHMEKDINLIVDIDQDEASKLIKLIELLIKEWYINRYERKQLLSSITSTNMEKQQVRKGTE